MAYRPLPTYLEIKKSGVEGLGLFTNQDILISDYIGITHIKDEKYGRINKEQIFDNDYIRTPLGGFINHSEDPNCELNELDGIKHLSTIKNISAGEELTLKYTMYNPITNN